ncbi:phage tail protein [Pectobacterium aroidearum]|uniref:phage tail protein n=1 Tax=Pectobacterium aroidearum TaxID=1201031 RepID=UPI002FCB7EE5
MSKYFALLTNIGAAKLANATALGNRLNITRMAVGDGGGVLPTPNPAQTKLINEKRRAALNTLSVDPKNPSQIIAEQVIPENEGGFWIREIGLFDDDGNLIAIANCAETYKPQLQEGSGRIQTVRMILIVSGTDAVTLKIDPAVVLATRGYVDSALAEHEKSRKHPDGTLTAKGFVQLSSATNSTSEVLAATPKAVKAAMDNANGRVPSGRKVNGKALTADITLGAGDVGAYTKAETDTKVSAATAAATSAATAAANANTNANGRVPSGRKVNGKALTADIALGAGDVGAYTKAETDTKVAAATAAATSAATAAANANTNANGRVPSGRKVNGKALTVDIALGAGDVGAYTKAETDTKVAAATAAATSAATAAANANTNANGRVPSSRKVNGKVLTADVSLTAGDVGALPTTGGAITGSITISNDSEIKWDRNTDFAKMGFKNDNDADANSYFYFRTGDNGNEYFRWDHEIKLGVTEWMTLKADGLRIKGNLVYHTGYKPTAADVGALTDAQAAQKYALRSIRVNGKPLSADVNLQAGDINAWNKTESDARYLMRNAVESTVIYPGGTESVPPTIGLNQRLEVTSPYSTLNCMIQIELLVDNEWGVASNCIYEGTAEGATFGIAASLINTKTIIVKTGSRQIIRFSNYDSQPWSKGKINGYRLRITKFNV